MNIFEMLAIAYTIMYTVSMNGVSFMEEVLQGHELLGQVQRQAHPLYE
jgi:hypothetical protein